MQQCSLPFSNSSTHPRLFPGSNSHLIQIIAVSGAFSGIVHLLLAPIPHSPDPFPLQLSTPYHDTYHATEDIFRMPQAKNSLAKSYCRNASINPESCRGHDWPAGSRDSNVCATLQSYTLPATTCRIRSVGLRQSMRPRGFLHTLGA